MHKVRRRYIVKMNKARFAFLRDAYTCETESLRGGNDGVRMIPTN